MKTKEFRETVTKEFLNVLKDVEDGKISGIWDCPWFKGTVPQNGATKRKYNGINQFHLSFAQNRLGTRDPRWYTFNQISDVKGYCHPKEKWHLKAGQKGTWVEYWQPYNHKLKKAVSWEEMDSDCTLFPRYSCVFNGSQIEGIPEWKDDPTTKGTTERSEIIQTISENMNVPICEDSIEGRSYYSPMNDEIHLPEKGSFKTRAGYDLTALHELCHATGHESRLNRQIKNIFGSEDYAYEELIAEIGSCYAAKLVSDDPSKIELANHKKYVSSWIEAIEKKPDALRSAIREAEKAADFITARAVAPATESITSEA